MPGNDHRPEPQAGCFTGDSVERDLTLAELADLAEEGRASGLSEEDGEALIDRLIAKYRNLVRGKSGRS